MKLTDEQKRKALVLAGRVHDRYDRMSLDDAVRELSFALAEAYVVMHGAGILRACGGEEEAHIIEGTV